MSSSPLSSSSSSVEVAVLKKCQVHERGEIADFWIFAIIEKCREIYWFNKIDITWFISAFYGVSVARYISSSFTTRTDKSTWKSLCEIAGNYIISGNSEDPNFHPQMDFISEEVVYKVLLSVEQCSSFAKTLYRYVLPPLRREIKEILESQISSPPNDTDNTSSNHQKICAQRKKSWATVAVVVHESAVTDIDPLTGEDVTTSWEMIFTRCQRSSLTRRTKKLIRKKSGAKEVYRNYRVPVGLNVLHYVKLRLRTQHIPFSAIHNVIIVPEKKYTERVIENVEKCVSDMCAL